MLSLEEVRHIAKLARLTLSAEEEVAMQKELSSILTYVDQLKEVDTSKVEATAQVTGSVNAFREDVVIEKESTPDELLAVSPLKIIDHQIVVPSAHG